MSTHPEYVIQAQGVEFSIDGKTITAAPEESIIEVAKRNAIDIPHLCYKQGLRADGNCRACMVEIEGERVLQPACVCRPAASMVVHTNSLRARHAQKMVLELLQSDMTEHPYTLNNELDQWSQKLHIGLPRFTCRTQPQHDLSHPAIAVNLDACIQCTRCVRACREEQNNDVIGYAMRGSHAAIVFDLDDPMGDSSCVGCGECVQACPTGALMPSDEAGLVTPDRKVDSICPYCGVGCLLAYNIKDEKIIYVEGRDGPANKNRLCVKGRYGFGYVHSKARLTKPLVRKPGVGKVIEIEHLTFANIDEYFRQASWDEALAVAAKGLVDIRDQHGPNALAGFGSAKGSNEEAYLFQKLVRSGFRTNNVDHCTRLCHSSSVKALLESVGSAAVSNQVEDIAESEVILVVGANVTENHPVAATFMKNAARQGKTLIVIDPRRTDLARHAKYFLQCKLDTDVAMLNAIMHSVIKQGLTDQEFIKNRTQGITAFTQHLLDYPPEQMEKICGIKAETLHEVAKVYASSKASIIFWGMGVSQHIHGTDNARCLVALSLLSGQIGRHGTGLHPLRGQNNVQGASDVGLIPAFFPDYQHVGNHKAQAHFEKLWHAKLDNQPGLTVVEIMHAIDDGALHGMYIMGENPAMSDPNLNHARKALAMLEHLVVQDIFMTETAWFADVILPASAMPEKTGTFTNTDRRVQLSKQAILPPGDARQDLWIIQEIAKRMGLTHWKYCEPAEVYKEMQQSMDSIKGLPWERLETQRSVTYPCENEDGPGETVIFTENFPTENGLGRFVPAKFTNADELPDAEYPYVLVTGRQLEHWHTGSMTRRVAILDAIEPVPVANLHPQDIAKIGAKPGDKIKLTSRRGSVECFARADDGLYTGQVFMPFCYREAAANLLTNEALDPFAKIPEFKFCALQVEPAQSH